MAVQWGSPSTHWQKVQSSSFHCSSWARSLLFTQQLAFVLSIDSNSTSEWTERHIVAHSALEQKEIPPRHWHSQQGSMRYTCPSENSFPLWTHLGETEEKNREKRNQESVVSFTTSQQSPDRPLAWLSGTARWPLGHWGLWQARRSQVHWGSMEGQQPAGGV
ncbi:hypothetical protein EYF80_002416 [Liparis tanakae]|uniref:Uncharacterized protein n=1 Tax=Liparis tanakae TaxID=230148 RepID=A0A4Z2JBK2_9TELE|nr:hypothetical protein EYF80_002416 [Liparis tanakae]